MTEPINAQCQIHIQSIQKAKTHSIQQRPKTGWQAVTLPDNWQKHWPNYQGAAWYKIQWSWQCQSDSTLKDPIAFSIDYVNSAGALFLNNDLLWSDKNLVEPLSKSWNVPRYWILPIAGLRPEQNEILIYVSGYAFQKAGLGKIEFNDIRTNIDRHNDKVWNHRTLFQINMILSATLAVICFIIWMFRRADSTFGWFALSLVLWVGFIANLLLTETAPFLSSVLLSKLNIICFIFCIYCFNLYLWRFIHRCFPKIEKIVLAFSILLSLLLLLAPIQYLYFSLNAIFLLYAGLFFCNYLYISYVAIQSRHGEYIFLMFCLTGIVFFTSLDILMLGLNKNYDVLPLSPYSSPVITLFVVVILGTRLTRNIEKIEKFNLSLAHKVEQVSAELHHSLNEKHQLELNNARLQERMSLSHDLHDGLGASIVRSMILVDQSSKNIPNQQFLSMLKLLRDDLRQIIDTGSTSDNRVPDTPLLWIAPLRHRFSQIMDELEIHAHWHFPSEWKRIPNALQCLSLLRVIEESLINVVKHSRALDVRITLVCEPQGLMLSIRDNGIGFNVQSVQHNGMSIGMHSMKIRMQRLGGTFEVFSQAGSTLIKVFLPLKSSCIRDEDLT